MHAPMHSCCGTLSSAGLAGAQACFTGADTPGGAAIKAAAAHPLPFPPTCLNRLRRLSVQPVTRQQWEFVLGLEEQQPGEGS